MKCPYCQEEMEKGVIFRNTGNICWEDYDKTYGLTFFQLMVRLSHYDRKNTKLLPGSFDPRAVTAYRCAYCKKMILESYFEE